ncbi:conserved hypothetical protein [Desulfosarcina cetonica]|uniref:hypothetical protein n=1 Tax=Desulfosarcina cetonica TaxID=90730 RepID=UPI0006D25651|nr:hypothetical protein [Desulfosarcina cetonica]VTR69116.1 conserved hypothetical protein [Desulfosarcina cetonica]
MGEIKSTLDLVMERTKHLSMSAEEKTRQHQEDFSRRLQGLLQQFGDGGLTLKAFDERLDALQTELEIADTGLVLNATLGRIDPDGENGPWLALLGELAPATREPLEKILQSHREARTALVEEARSRQLERLAREKGIGGSAVVPNPNRDADFQQRLEGLCQQIRQRIDALAYA